MMTKRIVALLLCILICLPVFSGCGIELPESLKKYFSATLGDELAYPDNGVLEGEEISDGRVVGGYKEGLMGELMQTYWFSYKIDRLQPLTSFGEKEAPKGKKYLQLDLLITSTYWEALEFQASEFYLIYAAAGATEWEDFADPVVVESREKTAETFSLNAGEEKIVTLLYELPLDAVDFALVFTEYYSDEIEGNTFYHTFYLE